MKTCKWCKNGYNYCDNQGLCTYCYLGSVMGKYPVRKNQDDTCPSFEADEDEEDEEAEVCDV